MLCGELCNSLSRTESECTSLQFAVTHESSTFFLHFLLCVSYTLHLKILLIQTWVLNSNAFLLLVEITPLQLMPNYLLIVLIRNLKITTNYSCFSHKRKTVGAVNFRQSKEVNKHFFLHHQILKLKHLMHSFRDLKLVRLNLSKSILVPPGDKLQPVLPSQV